MLNLFIENIQQLRVINNKIVANNLARLKLEKILDQRGYDLSGTGFKDFVDKEYSDYQYRIIVKKIRNEVQKVVLIVKDRRKVRAKLITLVAEEN